MNVLSIAHPYRHKNLAIVPRVAAAARRLAPERRLRFVLTAPENSLEWREIARQAERLGASDAVESVGRVAVAEVVDLYRSMHLAFVPTLLETSTAAYPEAMAMGLPIVTTDLDFAHDACGPAAVYYPPTNAEEAATRLLSIVESPPLWGELTDAGRRRLESLPDAASRYDRTVAALRELAGCSTTETVASDGGRRAA